MTWVLNKKIIFFYSTICWDPVLWTAPTQNLVGVFILCIYFYRKRLQTLLSLTEELLTEGEFHCINDFLTTTAVLTLHQGGRCQQNHAPFLQHPHHHQQTTLTEHWTVPVKHDKDSCKEIGHFLCMESQASLCGCADWEGKRRGVFLHQRPFPTNVVGKWLVYAKKDHFKSGQWDPTSQSLVKYNCTFMWNAMWQILTAKHVTRKNCNNVCTLQGPTSSSSTNDFD